MDHERGRATRVEQDGPVEVVRLRRAASFCKIDHCPDLPKMLRDSEADLLHLHTPNPSMILGLMLSGDRRPLVVSHYSDVVKQRLRRVLFSPIERACYDRARLILSEVATVHSRVSACCGAIPTGWPSCRSAWSWPHSWTRRPRSGSMAIA